MRWNDNISNSVVQSSTCLALFRSEHVCFCSILLLLLFLCTRRQFNRRDEIFRLSQLLVFWQNANTFGNWHQQRNNSNRIWLSSFLGHMPRNSYIYIVRCFPFIFPTNIIHTRCHNCNSFTIIAALREHTYHTLPFYQAFPKMFKYFSRCIHPAYKPTALKALFGISTAVYRIHWTQPFSLPHYVYIVYFRLPFKHYIASICPVMIILLVVLWGLAFLVFLFWHTTIYSLYTA